MIVGKGPHGFVSCPCTSSRRCGAPPPWRPAPNTQHMGLASVAKGSCVAAGTVVHSIRGITALKGLMGALRRAVRLSALASQLTVRSPEPRVATKESDP